MSSDKKKVEKNGGKKRKLAAAATTESRTTNNNESDLLASLGSSLQNMDDYEEGVLKSAELEQTPKLGRPAGNNEESSSTFSGGFPSLSSLAPSGRPLSDLPQFQSVLASVRQALQQHPHNLTLLLQQQMLLNVIQSTTLDLEASVRPQEERKQEDLRRLRFRRQLVQADSSSSSSSARSKSNARLKMAPKSALKSKVSSEPSGEDQDDEDYAAARRLEEIKRKATATNHNNNSNKSVSFASVSTTTKTARRQRVGLQQRRNSQVDGDNNSEENQAELERRRKHLKKLREEREKRREERRKRWLSRKKTPARPSSSSSTLKTQQKEDSEDEEEFEFDIATPQRTLAGDMKKTTEAATTSSAAEDDPPPAALPPRHFTACPLCEEHIEADTPGALDERLSRHMAECQTSRPRRRGRGGTIRQSSRRAASTVKSYAEDEGADIESRMENGDNDDDDDDDEMVAPPMDDEDDEELVVDSSEVVLVEDNRTSKNDVVSDTLMPPNTLDDFEEDDYEDRVDDWIEHGIRRMRVMKERDETEVSPGEETYDGGLTIPAWVNDRLFSYQRTGLQWMWELHQQQAGGIIGDEMGLGKTVQLCAFLGSMAASRRLKSVLVIAPATMLQHWLSEMKTWAPGIRRILIHQSAEAGGPLLSSKRTISSALLRNIDAWLKDSRKYRLFEAIDEDDYNSRDPSSFCGTAYAFVTTYENIRRNPDIWTMHPWSYVVMDEAQKIRNPDADITLVCKRLRTPHRLALSGTPIQNDLRELWSLFDFVFPGRLGTLPAFENEFADPIKRGGYSNASPMQVQLAYRCALVLRDLINPYLLRRLKKDIKEVNRMPGKKEQVLFCRLSNRQRMLYEAFLGSDQVKQVMRGSTQMLGAITMLRKICNHPDLVCPPGESSLQTFLQKGSFNEEDFYDQDLSDDDGVIVLDGDKESAGDTVTDRSGKLEVLARILPLWKKQGHRVLIFCQWKKMLDIIQQFTESQDWKFGRLDGNTNVAARQRLVDRFNSDDSYYGMLMTTRTGGVGLNLTGADRIILYDPDWNPQTDAQARERAWRFGQEREVTIYRLISAGTVEEKIYQRQIFKTALSNRILQDPRQRRLFSQKDLKDLFTLKIDSGSVAAGSEGLTETGQLTQGEGYIDPDSKGEDETKNEDDGETMQSVLRSKGLAGVFDHDIVESNKLNKKASVREMEENAKKVARAAVGALKESVAGHDTFTPTWTGSEETQEGGRFGENRTGGTTNLFGNSSPGIGGKAAAATSISLLASIRERNEAVESEGNGGLTKNSTKQYTALLQRIRTFVRRQTPTSDELLDEFSSIKSYDAAVFRRLLKSVASIRNGRWRLKAS